MTVAGKCFGSWTVVSADATGKRAGCRCACGTVRVIAVEALASGASTSCGCQRLAPVRVERFATKRHDCACGATMIGDRGIDHERHAVSRVRSLERESAGHADRR